MGFVTHRTLNSYHSQTPPSFAAPLSLSVEMGGASPAGGFVMERTTVGMELMNSGRPAVREHQAPSTLFCVLKNKEAVLL